LKEKNSQESKQEEIKIPDEHDTDQEYLQLTQRGDREEPIENDVDVVVKSNMISSCRRDGVSMKVAFGDFYFDAQIKKTNGTKHAH
jgi:hypothetical protein